MSHLRKKTMMAVWRAILPCAFVFYLLMASANIAWADDCTDTGDCAMAPRNIDGATALAAAGPLAVLAWLYLSRRNGAPREPRSAAELASEVANLKEEFERLEEQLRAAAVEELGKVHEFTTKYNEKWAEGMGALEDYLEESQYLLPDLQKIWEQFGSREEAREIAEALDEAVGAVSLGVGLVRGAAAGAYRQAARAARQAGGRLEAEAARRAVREVIEREARVAREAAERRVAREAAERTEREAAERELARAQRDVADAERRIAEGRAQEAARQRAERETLERARRDVDAADLEATMGEIEAGAARDAALAQLEREALLRTGPYANVPNRSFLAGSDRANDRILQALSSHIPPEPGVFDVFVHGGPGRAAIHGASGQIGLTEHDLLLAMRANGYQGGPVRLFSCSGGRPAGVDPSMAERLSRLIGNEVRAPDNTIWVYPNGTTTIGPTVGNHTGNWVSYGAGSGGGMAP